MPWWFFRRRRAPATAAGPTGSTLSAPDRQTGEGALPRLQGNRRYLQEQPYLLPKDLGEVNRLDFQHYVLRSLLRGNYLAPIGQPRRILDVGCGTGQWAFELAQQFPQAEVIGFDLEQVKVTSTPPANFRFVQGDALQGLPFESGSFDFVHQRLLILAVPLPSWPGLVQELARVTAPGGWVELVETSTMHDFVPAGPATRAFYQLGRPLAALRGLDVEGVVLRSLERYLVEAGLINIQRQLVEAPVGDWGGRLGSLLALDLREASKAVSGPIATLSHVPEQEVLDLIERASQEWNTLQTRCPFVVTYGQKPVHS
jgi:hypothetical protein